MYKFNIFSFTKRKVSSTYRMYTFIKDLSTKSFTIIFSNSVMIIFRRIGSKGDTIDTPSICLWILLLKLSPVLVQELMITFNNTFCTEKKNIDRSTLYSFKGSFELLHADITDLRFLAKSAVNPKYCRLIVDLFTSNIYTYPMKKGRF